MAGGRNAAQVIYADLGLDFDPRPGGVRSGEVSTADLEAPASE
jgi:hypothetical protein